MLGKGKRYDFIIIDCKNLIYRNWWHNRLQKTSAGVHIGLEFGFIRGIMKIIRVLQPRNIILAWEGESKRCSEIFPIKTNPETGKLEGYKCKRNKPKEIEGEPDWKPRIDRLKEGFSSLLHSLYDPDSEADEEIARFVCYTEKNYPDFRNMIISNDEDLHQLVSPRTDILRFGREGEEDIVWGEKEVENHWGVNPGRIPLRLSLEGDSSDDIPGIPRLRKTDIIDLVYECNSIDDLLYYIETGECINRDSLHEKLLKNIEIVKRNYQLVCLNLCMNIKKNPTFISGTVGSTVFIRKLCEDLEMKSFLYRKEWDIMEQMGKEWYKGILPEGCYEKAAISTNGP